MTSTDKPKTADRVASPLHLLKTLTRTLNEHLTEACEKAIKDAGKALEKLQRQQEKLEDKLKQSEARLAERTAEDPNKPASKTRRKIADLRAALETLEQSRNNAERYIAQLEADVRQTLRLAKGLDRIDAQVTQQRQLVVDQGVPGAIDIQWPFRLAAVGVADIEGDDAVSVAERLQRIEGMLGHAGDGRVQAAAGQHQQGKAGDQQQAEKQAEQSSQEWVPFHPNTSIAIEY